jgi:hypothetical protein
VIERYGMGGEEAANDRLLRSFVADERETGSWAGSKASAGG